MRGAGVEGWERVKGWLHRLCMDGRWGVRMEAGGQTKSEDCHGNLVGDGIEDGGDVAAAARWNGIGH